MSTNAFLLGALFILAPMALSAQSMGSDQDVSLSYGRESGTEIITGALRKAGESNVKESTTGNMFATYRYSFTRRFSLGVAFGTESFSCNRYSDWDLGAPPIISPTFIAKYNFNVTTIAIEPKLTYYNGRRVKLYGFCGLGVRYLTETSSPSQTFMGVGGPVFINTQMTPIGVSYGNKLSGYAEIGMGYKGLINGGIAYRIGRKQLKNGIENK